MYTAYASTTAGAASAASTAPTVVISGSYTPLPAQRSLAAAKQDPSAQVYDARTHTTTSLSTGKLVTPNTGVPSGYTLVEQTKSTYIYVSKPYYMDVEFCNSSCVQQAEVAAQVKENVTGGDSKNWALTEYGSTIAHENSSISWRYTAIYYCGINVSGSADHTCVNGAEPSGTEAPMTPGEAVGKRFETINSGIDYPMVGITVIWSTGGSKTGKFREWDTCNSTNSTLCANTGLGN